MGPGPDGMNYLTLEIWLRLPLFFPDEQPRHAFFSCFKRRWQAHLFLSGPFHLVEANDGQRRADFQMTRRTANVSLPGHLPDCVCEMNREKCCPTFCKPRFSHHLRRRSILLSSIFSPQDKLFMLATPGGQNIRRFKTSATHRIQIFSLISRTPPDKTPSWVSPSIWNLSL